MKQQICAGCLTAIRQGFSNGKLLFCAQSCEQDFYDNGNRPVKRRRLPSAR
jgi:hypothetical protein